MCTGIPVFEDISASFDTSVAVVRSLLLETAGIYIAWDMCKTDIWSLTSNHLVRGLPYVMPCHGRILTHAGIRIYQLPCLHNLSEIIIMHSRTYVPKRLTEDVGLRSVYRLLMCVRVKTPSVLSRLVL